MLWLGSPKHGFILSWSMSTLAHFVFRQQFLPSSHLSLGLFPKLNKHIHLSWLIYLVSKPSNKHIHSFHPVWLTPSSPFNKARCLSHFKMMTSIILHLFQPANDSCSHNEHIHLFSIFLAAFPCLVDKPRTTTLVVTLFLVNKHAHSLSILAMVSWLGDEP